MSCVSWPCRKLRASGPVARITPQSGRRTAPWGSGLGGQGVGVMRRLSSAPMRMVGPRGFGALRVAAAWCSLLLLVALAAGAPGGGWTARWRWPAAASSCRSSPAPRRARWPQAWVDAGVQTTPRLLYAMVPLVGPGAAHPRRQLRDRRRHHAAPPAGQDGAGRRDAGDTCACSKAGRCASCAPRWPRAPHLKPTIAGMGRRRS